jgi:hypothetical protein
MGSTAPGATTIKPLAEHTWDLFAALVVRPGTTATRRSRGPSTGRRPSCPTSTTASSTWLTSQPPGRPSRGVVEGYPHIPGERRLSSSFLYNATRAVYERAGFEFVRPKGLKNTVMRRTVEPA